MLQFPDGPRKQRTRQHIISDQSVNHVERIIIDAGYVVHRVVSDYGYDLVITTFDDQGYIEPGVVFLQLKASDALRATAEKYAYDLDVRDYNLWRLENQPVCLILFDARTRRAYWVHVQEYFATVSRRPRKGAKSVRVLIPRRQRLNAAAVTRVRTLKNGLFLKPARGSSDG